MSRMGTNRKQPFGERLNQAGMVSIMVTMVLMIVISLIVLGFAQISRRNQRQQLDRQLSTQAFYAAETGVNDVTKLITDELAAHPATTVPAKDDCANTGIYSALNNVLDANSRVEYSCVTLDPTPAVLQYGDVDNDAVVAPLSTSSGTSFSTLKLTWRSKDNTATPLNNCPTAANGAFTTTANWQCGYGVLRFDLVPVNGNFDAEQLRQRTMTTFVVPMQGAAASNGPINFAQNAANTNARFGLRCTNADCNLTIQNLNTDKYYLRVGSIYKGSSLQITGTDASGNPVEFKDGQVVIDSTGKAQDVLRRIQVRVPLTGGSKSEQPSNALESTGAICKRFAMSETFFQKYITTTEVPDPGVNHLCSDVL